MVSSNDEKPLRWRKNLYSNTGYPDNYTDVTFLTSLRRNPQPKTVAFLEAVLGAGLVTEQLCVLLIFYSVHQAITDNLYQAESVLFSFSGVTGLCYCAFLSSVDSKWTVLKSHCKILTMFFILGCLLSPVLKTLTETISSDTIDATAIVMMLIHLIFYDYQVPAAIASRALSLNAAIFSSLCLASRLNSSFDAFVLLTISIQCFVLYPTFASSMRNKLSLFWLLFQITVTMFIISYLAQATKMLSFFIICVIFINFICPVMFVHCQRYKMNIYGPWDEAIIEPD